MKTDAQPAIYCVGCNQRFLVSPNSQACPRCGAESPDEGPSMLARTMLIKPGRTERVATLDQPQADELIGRTIDVYRCESLLGMGGMGRVYLAYHQDLHRHCALKVLAPELAEDDADFVNRFLAEGRTAASLVHPHVVTTHAVGRADDLHFLEMEFVQGRSLQDLIDEEGRTTPTRALVLARQIADGLAVAHRAGIVHRDLKPDNVMLTSRAAVKIADFGLAKRIGSISPDLPAKELAGTPNFMAPEVLHGEPSTTSSDVYSLGVTLYLLLTGRLPFGADSFAELVNQATTQKPRGIRRDFPEIGLEVVECVSMLMARSPANRPIDGVAALHLIDAVLGQVRDVESLLREAFMNHPEIQWERDGEQFDVTVELRDGRSQRVRIESSDHGPHERLLQMYSVCCDADSRYFEQALRMNSRMSHAGVAIREIDGRAKFVVVDSYPRGTVDPEEVRRSTLEIAQRADAVEFQLTGRDVN